MWGVDMAKKSNTKVSGNDYGIDLDTATSELEYRVESAVNFLQSEFSGIWETAERYYAGKTDLQDVDGRSNVVKTEVRDAIRNVRPSIMRTLLHSRKPVVYTPTTAEFGAWAEQQSIYINQRFWACDGYRQILSAIDQAAKLKAGPIKAYWVEDPLPTYFKSTKMSLDDVRQYQQNEAIDISDVSAVRGDDGVHTYDVEGYHYEKNGRIKFESIPIYEFFIDRNSSGIQDAVEFGVHGHRRDVTVAEAMELGLEYDDWRQLDPDDPELNQYVGMVYEKLGYQKDGEKNYQSDDITKHTFSLTECYARYDLKGTGRPQLYCFWLGGTSYRYIDHEEVEDSPFELVLIDPIPDSAFGHSITDLTLNGQDTGTSLLRALVDNTHMSNNPRHAGDPNRVNFDDLMNNVVGAHVRTKGDAQVQTLAVPYTGQGVLATLTYLDQDIQEKVGITKAAQGLDPNAMQSTDKEAVRNTIAMSQGQVEFMVRNVVETGLIPLFKKMLRLEQRHRDPMQVMEVKGKYIPVNLRVFNPDWVATPNVGLGTQSPEQQATTLGFVLQKQEQIMQTMGPANPMTSMAQIYNTIEDIVELGGLVNTSRYFNIVTPEVEAEYAKQEQQKAAEAAKAAKEQQPTDPASVMMAIESGKARVKMMEIMAKSKDDELTLQQKALTDAEKLDIQRDQMVQDRSLKLIELKAKSEEARIAAAQKANDNDRPTTTGGSIAAE